jgi:dihydrofolate reductase
VGKVVVFTSVTLDGVMQAPGRPDEDRRGGFQHGGWAVGYSDEIGGQIAGESMANTGGILLGRRTYEDILPYWNETGGPFKDMLNNSPKYIASTTLREPLPWPNSTLLAGDVGDAVAKLTTEQEKDLVVIGSGELARGLMARDLVDTFVLLIHPLVLGDGRRLFEDGIPNATLKLVDSKTTTTGVIVATYETAKAIG